MIGLAMSGRRRRGIGLIRVEWTMMGSSRLGGWFGRMIYASLRRRGLRRR